MQPRLLEQAAAPADARDDVAVDRGHVCGERLVEPRRDVREQLVAAVGAGGDDRVGAVRGVDERCRPRRGRVRAVDRDRAHVAERAREPERLQRQVVVRLDEDEDAHATPSPCITSTTRGAAAAPSPRISACLPWPFGRTSRSFSSFESGRAGSTIASGFDFARSRPGTDG